MITGMFNPFGGTGGSGGGGGGKIKNFSNGYFFQEEQLCSFNASECIANTEVPYGQYGSRVITRLQISNEEEIAAWQINTSETEQCIYDREDQLGAYAGYVFTQPKYITRVKIWATIHKWQNKALTFTLQYLTEDDEWIDYCDYVVDPQTPYPSNVFETRLYIGFSIKGIRWCHYKRPEKTTSNNIIFAGMTVYEGIGISTKVYTPISDFNPIPEGYSGFSAILSKGVANLGNKEITANGIYQAMDDSLDGYRQINVNVPPPERYMTIDEVDNNGEPIKLHFYGQPGDAFNYLQPDTNTSLPQAFKKATEIVLDENYTSFGQPSTFCNRPNLVSVNLPSQITVIPSGTFKGCQSLTSSYNLSTITEVGQYAFYQCYLADIYADLSNLTRIEDHAFESCRGIDYVKITNNTTYIGQRAFYECRDMNGDFDLSGVTTIKDAAFQYCESIDQPLNISNVSAMDAYTFDGCKKIPSITLANDWTFTGSGGCQFRDCEALTSIPHFGSSVKTVPQCAFQNCKNLTMSFDLSNVTSINNNAFDGCEKVPSFTLGVINGIGSNAFKNCKAVTSMDFSNSTFTNIPSQVFANCISLQSITLPSTLVSISSECFKNCTSLQSFTSPSSLTSIATECFRDCTSLLEVDLSNSTSFGWGQYNSGYIYAGCTSLTTVKYPPSREIRFYSHDFDGCENLTTLVIPASSSVKNIGDYAFYGTGFTELPSIFPTATLISSHCFDGSKLQTLTIPDGVTTVNSWAFANCEDLTTITFPTNTITINSNTFANCSSLVSLRIPSNVKITASDIFATEVGASGIQTIYVEDRASLGTYTFRNNNSITDAYFAWSSSQSSSRYGLRNDVTIHYDWDPNAED